MITTWKTKIRKTKMRKTKMRKWTMLLRYKRSRLKRRTVWDGRGHDRSRERSEDDVVRFAMSGTVLDGTWYRGLAGDVVIPSASQLYTQGKATYL